SSKARLTSPTTSPKKSSPKPFTSASKHGTTPNQEARAVMLRKLPLAMVGVNEAQMGAKLQEMQKNLHAEEVQVMDYIRARHLLRTEDSTHIDNFSKT
ncbi:MAG: hypothetical protein Q9184_008449, partial [Pyrenodesmia sp. 2 TL-2023]